MIPKLLCYLFGHVYFHLAFAGTTLVWSKSAGRHVLKALQKRVERSHCYRCNEHNPAWQDKALVPARKGNVPPPVPAAKTKVDFDLGRGKWWKVVG